MQRHRLINTLHNGYYDIRIRRTLKTINNEIFMKVFKCIACNELCMEEVEIRTDGTVIHNKCGEEVMDVTDEMDKYPASSITDCYD